MHRESRMKIKWKKKSKVHENSLENNKYEKILIEKEEDKLISYYFIGKGDKRSK